MTNRTFIAHSPLGEQLLFRSLEGHEQISRLFEYRVRLLSDNPSISANQLLGKDLSIEIDLTTQLHGGDQRFLSGQITQFTYAGRDGDFYSYLATLSPWLWHATRRSDFRIFQNQTVPDVIKQVLGPYGFTIDDRLVNSYRTWVYLVQYGESDFNFVSRMLEEEGAYFYFKHKQGSHTLVLSDDIGSHQPLVNGQASIPYYPNDRAAQVRDEDFIDHWSFAEDIASGRFAADDYDFEKPRAPLDTQLALPAGHAQDDREIYEWPGGYIEMGDGENYARVRTEQQKAQRKTVQGEGNARNIAPGFCLTLRGYPRADQNAEYLIESAQYRFEENVRRSDGGGGGGSGSHAGTPTTYRISFHAVPKSTQYRSQRVTARPRTTGPQTAVITGPAGEEIHTDPYGRVKVQFHWDRYGKKDENSSCWIRVSQNWAGSGYGTMHIPRIGQEVIVDFLNGDPDYPIITGSVYNAMQMPPWDLPANKTQTGIKTRSSLDGTSGDGLKDSPGTANALRFEDKKGAEQLWLHAQKDQLTEVEHDEDKWVGNDRRKVIDRDEFNTIHRDRTEIVDRNEKINVHGWRTEEVDLDETITIHGQRTETVDKNETLTVHQNRARTVDRNETLSIGKSRTKDVGKSETDSIGQNWTVTTGMVKTESVGLLSTFNIGLMHAENVGLLNSSLVGGKRIEISGLDKTETVSGPRTTSVKSDTLTVEEAQSVSAKTIELQATHELRLSCGSSSIRLTPEDLQALSTLIRLNC